MNFKKWTIEEKDFLSVQYPEHGKMWCAKKLNRNEGSIRWMASELGIKQNHSGSFSKNWQKRAAQSKIGKKRPDQSVVMKRIRAEGKILLTKEGKKAIGEAVRKRLKEKGHPKGMKGKKHNLVSCAKMSIGQKKRAANITPQQWAERGVKMVTTKMQNHTLNSMRKTDQPYSRTVSGKRPDLNNQFFRSKVEANYARYLNLFKIKWEYEPKDFYFEAIRRGVVSYTPDFYLPETDEWIEVKGWFDNKSQTKLRRFKKYYPAEFSRLKLITQSKKTMNVAVDMGIAYERYEDISKNARGLILGWEL